jgi:DNA-binding MarR family transcriptional regulator
MLLNTMAIVESFPETVGRGAELAPDTLEIMQAATRVLAGIALRSLDVLDGAVTLPQFRILAVLADCGRARSAQIAQMLGIESAAVTRFADRMVAAGYASRQGGPSGPGEAVLELSASGEDLVGRVAGWRERELARIAGRLPLAERTILDHALRRLVEVAGESYGTATATASIRRGPGPS